MTQQANEQQPNEQQPNEWETDEWEAERRAQDREVNERLAMETAGSPWWTRVAASVGGEVALTSSDGHRLRGVVVEAGRNWCVLKCDGGTVVVNLEHVAVMEGPQRVLSPARLAERIGPGPTYRWLARTGASVQVTVSSGSRLRGRIVEVLNDAFTLRPTEAASSDALAYRNPQTDAVLTIPFVAVIAVATKDVDASTDRYS